MEPRIYSLAAVPTPAKLGPDTVIEEEDGCDVCGQRPSPSYRTVEYVFDRWDGEDLVRARDTYGASDRLWAALQTANVRGISFAPLVAHRADTFAIGTSAYEAQLPRFHLLVVKGEARGPELWWTSRVCDACGRRVWERTREGRRAETATISGAEAPPRQVYRDSWAGDDVFRIDPGLPVVTQRFVDTLVGVGARDVDFGLAEWV